MLLLTTRLIRLALSFLTAALIVGIIMVSAYRVGWLALSKLLLWVAIGSFLFGASVFLLLGLSSITQSITRQLKVYFSASTALQRQFVRSVRRHDRHARLFVGKIRQQAYSTEFKIKRLLTANNQQHCRQLSKSLQQELKRHHPSRPKQSTKYLKKQLRQAYRQQDIAQLLKLAHQITAYYDQDAKHKTVGNAF